MSTYYASFCGVGLHSAVDRASDYRSRGREFEPQLGCIIFMVINCEIISMLIITKTCVFKYV